LTDELKSNQLILMLMRKLSVHHISWLVALTTVLILAVYWLKFKPVPVKAHTVANGELRGEVMGTGTLEARIKTTISPRIQERLAEVLSTRATR
jgi:multidrug efflux pump subunit AcrA (membrane-fusion protein)